MIREKSLEYTAMYRNNRINITILLLIIPNINSIRNGIKNEWIACNSKEIF